MTTKAQQEAARKNGERGGRPRDPEVPSTTMFCGVHGKVEARIHRVGLRPNGTQKYRVRCPMCHAERNRKG